MDSALNFARLKELVTLGKSKNVQEGEECLKFESNPSKEDIKQIGQYLTKLSIFRTT